MPPPIPVKQRKSTNQHGSPSHTPSHRQQVTADSLSREGSVTNGGKVLPPVPMRIESIPWVKNALVQDSPPPKPPRTDRPPDIVSMKQWLAINRAIGVMIKHQF